MAAAAMTPGRADQNSICAPSSTTRFVGRPKNSVADRAFRDMNTNSFFRIVANYGFMQSPNIPEALAIAAARGGVAIPPMDTSYYLGRERLVLTGAAKMSRWRKALFALMSRNARSATEFFQIPPNRVVELGAQIEF